MTSEATQQAEHMNPMSSPSVMNHVMHASYGEVSYQMNCNLCQYYMLYFSVKITEGTFFTSSVGKLMNN